MRYWKSRYWSFPLALILLTALTGPVSPRQQSAPENTPPVSYPDVPLEVRCDVAPTPVQGDDGRWFLTYHLLLMNWAHTDVTVRQVDIRDRQGRLLKTYAATDLQNPRRFFAFLPYPRTALRIKDHSELQHIATGRTAVLFVWLPFDREKTIPDTLIHRVVLEPNPAITRLGENSSTTTPLTLETLLVQARREKPLVIGPPLEGGPWRCGHMADLDFHQTYLSLMDGRIWRCQKYSIDFSKVDNQGNVLPSPFPNDITNEMFYSYKARVLAAADGVVTYVKDGVPENKPLPSGATNAPVPLTRETFPGNQIAIQAAGGRYLFYAHLLAGSLRVKVGDRVHRGQVIALLGDSGNAAGPHLHFQVSGRNDLNASEGRPFVFDAFELQWRSSTSKSAPKDLKPTQHRRQIPLDGSVVAFPTVAE